MVLWADICAHRLEMRAGLAFLRLVVATRMAVTKTESVASGAALLEDKAVAFTKPGQKHVTPSPVRGAFHLGARLVECDRVFKLSCRPNSAS